MKPAQTDKTQNTDVSLFSSSPIHRAYLLDDQSQLQVALVLGSWTSVQPHYLIIVVQPRDIWQRLKGASEM